MILPHVESENLQSHSEHEAGGTGLVTALYNIRSDCDRRACAYMYIYRIGHRVSISRSQRGRSHALAGWPERASYECNGRPQTRTTGTVHVYIIKNILYN